MNWHCFPLFRILIAFILGVLASLLFPDTSFHFIAALVILFALCLSLVLYRNRDFHYRYDWIVGVTILLMGFIFGWQRTYDKMHFIDKNHFSAAEHPIAYIGYPEERPVERDNSWKATIRVTHIFDGEAWLPSEGKTLCYFAKDINHSPLPGSGENMIFFSAPEKMPPALNPYAFDYGKYLQKSGIAHRVYLAPDKWAIAKGTAPFSIFRKALAFRDKLLDILQNSPLSNDELNIASAILLGYDDALDPELRAIYSNVGAAHILCVSGLHVGTVFIIFNFLLSALNSTKRRRVLKAAILLMLTWSYALITGLAPAVFRASVMLTFIVIVQATGRRNITWNAIIVSALLLLVTNPLLLTDVGFQLSYAAVIAIVALQGPIHSLIYIPTKLGNSAWSLISVSIAAQIGTFPFVMYYFHQFPNWFLLTNLIVIPCSSVIIYTGIAMLTFSFVPFLKTAFSWMLFGEIRSLNYLMEWINNLPYTTISGINASLLELCLLVTFIVTGALALLRKSVPSLYAALTSLLLLLVSFTTERYLHHHQTEFVAFASGKSNVLGFVKGRDMLVVTDSAFLQNKNARRFVLDDYVVRKGITTVRFSIDTSNPFYDSATGVSSTGNGFVFMNETIYVTKTSLPARSNSLKCNYLFVPASYYGALEPLLNSFEAGSVIVSGSNNVKRMQKWSEAYPPAKIHFLQQEGALIKKY